jgi:uncharacterized protein YndB with AHSA1/START domain
MLAKPSLTLRRRIQAAPDRVFAAWTDPDKLVRWFGPKDVVAGSVRAEVDLRPGGRYLMAFETADGGCHRVGGIYREVVAANRLVFTWAWLSSPERCSLVTVTLVDDDDGTVLTLHHEQFFDDQARDAHQHGWTGALDRLEQLFA